MTPAPNTIHQNIIVKMVYEIERFLQQHKIGKIFCAPTDVKFSETNVLQPDIVFISRERAGIITENNIDGAPDLIIEILSPGTAYYDLIEKKEIYERFGVKEYWIVDPKKERVEIFLNVNSGFELKQKIMSKGLAKSFVMKGFEVSLAEIFQFY